MKSSSGRVCRQRRKCLVRSLEVSSFMISMFLQYLQADFHSKSLRRVSWGSPMTQLFSSLPAISPAPSLPSSLWHLTLLTTFFLKFYSTLALWYHSVLIFLVYFGDSFSLSCLLNVDVPESSLLAFCLFNSNSSSCDFSQNSDSMTSSKLATKSVSLNPHI